eukprot:SAG31_NODE_1593_length_7811_cov_13.037215_1_plen_89_part_00
MLQLLRMVAVVVAAAVVAREPEPYNSRRSMPPSALRFSTPQRIPIFRPYIPMLNGSSYPAGSKPPVRCPSSLIDADACSNLMLRHAAG